MKNWSKVFWKFLHATFSSDPQFSLSYHRNTATIICFTAIFPAKNNLKTITVFILIYIQTYIFRLNVKKMILISKLENGRKLCYNRNGRLLELLYYIRDEWLMVLNTEKNLLMTCVSIWHLAEWLKVLTGVTMLKLR